MICLCVPFGRGEGVNSVQILFCFVKSASTIILAGWNAFLNNARMNNRTESEWEAAVIAGYTIRYAF